MTQEQADGEPLSSREASERIAEITGTPVEEIRDGADEIDMVPPEELEWADAE